jgi:hypothetical protein
MKLTAEMSDDAEITFNLIFIPNPWQNGNKKYNKVTQHLVANFGHLIGKSYTTLQIFDTIIGLVPDTQKTGILDTKDPFTKSLN